MADTIKLILEGEIDVSIAIKNKASQKFKKRVPLLITSNHELWRYCSPERSSLDARCYKFNCNKSMTQMKFCPNKFIHKCAVLRTSSNLDKQVSSDGCHKDIGEGETTEAAETCIDNHPLNIRNLYAFIVLSFSKHRSVLVSERVSFVHDIDDLLATARSKNCFCSEHYFNIDYKLL